MFKKLVFFLFLFAATPAFATQYGISAYPVNGASASMDQWQAAMQDLKDAGVTASLESKTWHELEPSEGKYNVRQLAADLKDDGDRGWLVLFGIQLINTTRRDMPDDLNDVAWDDPAMITRFKALMAALKEQNPVPPKYISIGNEVDVYFQQHPAELPAYLKFFEKAAAAARDALPGAKVGVTLTYEGLRQGRTAIVQKLLEVSEVAIFTYYPVIDLKPLPIENVSEHIDSMVKAAGTHDVLLQEVGYPTGELLGSSELKQAQFYKYVTGAIAQHEQIKFANIFALGDFSEKDCNGFMNYYGFEKVDEGMKTKFQNFLCTLGLRDNTGRPKQSWETVKKLIK